MSSTRGLTPASGSCLAQMRAALGVVPQAVSLVSTASSPRITATIESRGGGLCAPNMNAVVVERARASRHASQRLQNSAGSPAGVRPSVSSHRTAKCTSMLTATSIVIVVMKTSTPA